MLYTNTPKQLPPSLDVLTRKLNTEKRATETWGYQILPTLYSVYQKVHNEREREKAIHAHHSNRRKKNGIKFVSIFSDSTIHRILLQCSCSRFAFPYLYLFSIFWQYFVPTATFFLDFSVCRCSFRRLHSALD